MMSVSNKSSSECQICSSPSFNSYYGVKSCEPCKVFFKRNAEKETLKCDFDGQCEINLSNRHICSACRLKKCLEVGMSIQMIRSSHGKKRTNLITSSALIRVRHQQYPERRELRRLNLLERDQSLLTIDQWNHLSNLIHSYDEHNALPIVQTYMKQLESLHPKLRFKIDTDQIYEIVTTVYQATVPFIRFNQDFASISSDDRPIVLRGAVDNLSCLGGGLLLRESGLMTSLAFCQGLEKAYGSIPYNLTLAMISLIDQDTNLVKLALALFAFCTSTSTFFNSNSSFMYISDYQLVLRIQNMYADLIWKYLLYKYTFNHAVVRFTHLVKCLVASVTIRTYLQTSQQHTNTVDSVIQKIEEQQQINIIDN